MKIKKIGINSFGKLVNKEIEFDDNINIIYGKNESGKSTVLNYIISMLYGIYKNKGKREFSELEEYTPWNNEEFSGVINYELDNNEKFEVFRDFKKKDIQIFNEYMENVVGKYNIDKQTGSQFFYEQTGINKELFLSTSIIKQQEIKLEKIDEAALISRITNLVTSGEDNVSYQKTMQKLNKKQNEEIGTDRTREKPINLLNRRLEELEVEKRSFENLERKKEEIELNKTALNQDIVKLEKEREYLKEKKRVFEFREIEEEKIKVQKNIKKENLETIKSLEVEKLKKEQELQKEAEKLELKNEKIKNDINKFSRNVNILFLITIIINVILYLTLNFEAKLYIILSIPIIIVIGTILKMKNKKQVNIQDGNEKLRAIREEIRLITDKIQTLSRHNKTIDGEIYEVREKIENYMHSEEERLSAKYRYFIEIKEILDLEVLEENLNLVENKISEQKIETHRLDVDNNIIIKENNNLMMIIEEIERVKKEIEELQELNESIELVKEILEESYEEMKNNITPKFTKELTSNVSYITNDKYKNVRYSDQLGLMVGLESGRYEPISKLSVGTIEQLYLSLRLSMIKDIFQEKMPIILDESFVYYDKQRLAKTLEFLSEKFKDNQIIILSCTNREENILKEANIMYKFIEI